MVPYLLIFALALSARSSSAATIHVPADQPTIQDGIGAASYGDLVLVAPGTYAENINFLGKAITLLSEAGAGSTVIDGSQSRSVVTFDSGESGDSVLDGFTVTNGNASYIGGGIGCLTSNPTISACTITRNFAEDDGGGVHCKDQADLTITNCTISKKKEEGSHL